MQVAEAARGSVAGRSFPDAGVDVGGIQDAGRPGRRSVGRRRGKRARRRARAVQAGRCRQGGTGRAAQAGRHRQGGAGEIAQAELRGRAAAGMARH
ncbi:hypothetical protein GCM10009827_031140 [Dactylosporangium maewongense]|uniref:Uncharacterized protein n=1 Tax=Dactylosporangium maewongense TaxID=634393 RepID=A0ABN2AAJ8_9ACTN